MKAIASNSAQSPKTGLPVPAGLISRKKLAAIMGVSTETIKRAERRGELQSLKFNSRLVRYSTDAVSKWFSESATAKHPLAAPPKDPFFNRTEAHEEALLKKAAAKKNN